MKLVYLTECKQKLNRVREIVLSHEKLGLGETDKIIVALANVMWGHRGSDGDSELSHMGTQPVRTINENNEASTSPLLPLSDRVTEDELFKIARTSASELVVPVLLPPSGHQDELL